jgi:hypothetical protein
MSLLRVSTVALLLTGISLVAVAGCSSASGSSTASASAVKGSSFPRNDILDDASLVDVGAMSESDVQSFLEKTPYGGRSGLADYTVGSQTASALIHDAAVKSRINPLVMLVRLQMEEGLINATDVPESKVDVAFGCGCESASSCADKYLGLANQATCMARTLRRDMDLLAAGGATVSGWKPCVAKKTEDGLSVTPANSATAALYTYTPWVGEAGGGETGVGGASLHKAVWAKYAAFIGYGDKKVGVTAATTCGSSGDTGGTTDDGGAGVTTDDGGTGATTDDGGTGTGGDTPPAGGCKDDTQCSGATPVCDRVGKTCVACQADYAAANAAPLACPSAAAPACITTGPGAGSCAQCSDQNSDACDANDTTPVCNATTGTCGCSSDGDCGEGQVCDGVDAGKCIAGCRVSGGADTCPTGKACSVKDGTVGACQGETCDQTGCKTAPNLKCDTSSTTPTCVECTVDSDCSGGKVCDPRAKKCVECTSASRKACDATKSGSACVTGSVCGCAVDADCGGSKSGRVCDKAAHACKAGCRDVGGNQCPDGQECSSGDKDVGTCKATPSPTGKGSGTGTGSSSSSSSSSGSGAGSTLGGGGTHVPSKGNGGGTTAADPSPTSTPDTPDGKKGCAVGATSPADGGVFFGMALALGVMTKRRRKAA